MNVLDTICVFCGSSDGNDVSIMDKAMNLGKKLAHQDITLVYGGAKIGIMGKVAQGVLENKGRVIGVIPEFLKVKEVVHTDLNKLVITENMHQRKMKMQELSDGFITLPGGLGTLEELFEVLTWAQLGLHQKPIGLLNINGFYNVLLELLQNMVAQGLMKKENLELLLVDTNIDDLLEKMKAFVPKQESKWLQSNTI